MRGKTSQVWKVDSDWGLGERIEEISISVDSPTDWESDGSTSELESNIPNKLLVSIKLRVELETENNLTFRDFRLVKTLKNSFCSFSSLVGTL